MVSFSATSESSALQTCRRITGSRPSTGSSRITTSGHWDMASQKAACFCIPLLSLRMGCFLSRSNSSASFSKRSGLKRGYTLR